MRALIRHHLFPKEQMTQEHDPAPRLCLSHVFNLWTIYIAQHLSAGILDSPVKHSNRGDGWIFLKCVYGSDFIKKYLSAAWRQKICKQCFGGCQDSDDQNVILSHTHFA